LPPALLLLPKSALDLPYCALVLVYNLNIMDTQDSNSNFNQPRHNGRIFAGLFLLFVGAMFLLKELSFPFFPDWIFTWPMLLIAIGIYTGIRHQFRNPGWIILVIIGGFFLTDQMDMGFNFHRFIVPGIIIAVGLVMILRPRYRHDWDWKRRSEWDWRNHQNPKPEDPVSSATDPTQEHAQNYSSDDFFESTSVFGGAKKVILSKNFRGGEITCVFGGCEIDLTQADMQKPAVIDLSFVFGGGKIIVPPNWQVRLDLTPIFGGVEDKRKQPIGNNPDKMLIIKGTCLFGGLELKNY
jgi:predicted membrane protein